MYFRPKYAKFLGPVYAIGEGFFVGAISRVFEDQWSGIVLQAAGATLAVFAVMLALYNTRIIKVTDKFRRTVIFATLGDHGAVPGVVRDLAVRRLGAVHQRRLAASASASASSSAASRR